MGKKKTEEKVVATNPQWATDAVSNVTGKVRDLSNLSPESLIAGSNPLLDRAQTSLMGNPFADAYSLINQGAAGGGSVSASKASDFYKDYENPYKDDILNPVLADYDEDAGRQIAAADLNLANNNAWGGSGAAIEKSMLGGQLARGRAATQGGLLQSMFDKAMGLSSEDANRYQQASVANAQLAEAAAARKIQAGGQLAGLRSQEIGQQLSLGDYLRQMEQQRLQAPITLAQQQSGILGGLPLGNWTGQNRTTTQSDPMGSLGSALMTGAALFGAPFTGGASLAGLGALGGLGAVGTGAGLGATLMSQLGRR